MTQTQSGAPKLISLSRKDLNRVEFSVARFGRGYETREVEEFFNQLVPAVEALNAQLHQAEEEIERLRQRVLDGARGEEVIQAVNIITAAQQTADSTVAQADSYSRRVMAEARAAYEDARRRGEQLELEAQQSVDDLALSATMHQEELDRQTAYLRTLRDATRTTMQKYLEGLLDHVAEEYGRAHPLAAGAASTSGSVTAAESVDETVHVNGNGSDPRSLRVNSEPASDQAAQDNSAAMAGSPTS